MLRRVGLGTLDQTELYGLSITLGGGEVTLLDLTSAYAAIAARGQLAEPYAVERVRDSAGRALYEHGTPATRQVLDPRHAYLLTDILSDADARIPGFGGQTPFELPFPAAAKSGTSSGFRDNWTLGFTPKIAIGVWVGNADGSPMVDVSGVEGAGPIWHDAMAAAALGHATPPFVEPDGIVRATVCAPTGLLPGPSCPTAVRELFVGGTEPTSVESYYQRGPDGVLLVDPPIEARAWARDAGLAVAGDTGSASTAKADLIRIVSPAPGSVIWIAPELATKELVLRASIGGAARVTFTIDGAVVGETVERDARATWSLVPGVHTLSVSAAFVDGRTGSASVRFEVRN